MRELFIRSSKGQYAVRFGPLFSGLEFGLASKEHLIIDSRVAELYAASLAPATSGPSILRIRASEISKSFEGFPAYINHLLEHGVRRDHTLIAVGGGIIQDIVSFISGILLRGVTWRFYPTTLLAQADSCIGSKASVNIGVHKNQLGLFNPPSEVMVSTEVLRTLDEIDVRSGIGEMIKVHIISGWDDVRSLAADYQRILVDKVTMEHYICRSLQIKKTLIEVDEFDRNERLILNYGHTFGHAIESATDYSVPHGIAVTIGMDMANYLSCRFALIHFDVYEQLHGLLAKNYAGFENIEIPESRFFEALTRDKKNQGEDVSLILMRGPGQLFLISHSRDEQFRLLCKDYFKATRCDTAKA